MEDFGFSESQNFFKENKPVLVCKLQHWSHSRNNVSPPRRQNLHLLPQTKPIGKAEKRFQKPLHPQIQDSPPQCECLLQNVGVKASSHGGHGGQVCWFSRHVQIASESILVAGTTKFKEYLRNTNRPNTHSVRHVWACQCFVFCNIIDQQGLGITSSTCKAGDLRSVMSYWLTRVCNLIDCL